MRNTQAETIRSWEKLVTACEENDELRPFIHRDLALLSRTAEQAHTHFADRLRLLAEKQEATNRCNAILTEGNDLAMRIRAAVKAALGPRNERLTQFGIAPLRKRRGRGRRKKLVDREGGG
jgi:hypothetical protein